MNQWYRTMSPSGSMAGSIASSRGFRVSGSPLPQPETRNPGPETEHLSNGTPRLILIMGVAGSGKTTLAKGILRHFRAVYLDNNQIVDAFFPDTRNGKRYEKLRPHFYKALYRIAEENLKVGNSVLLDVPHVKEAQVPDWGRFIKRLASRAKSTVVVLRCLCSESVLRARLCARGEKRDQWKLAHWSEFLREQPIAATLPLPHLDIDTEKDLSANTRAAVRYIRGAKRKAHGA